MINLFKLRPVLLLLLIINTGGRAQQIENFEKNGYKLTFINHDVDLNSETKRGLINTFFEVYPQLVKDFNKSAMKHVIIQIDTAYGGVAYANNGKITVSSNWLKRMPRDFDMITHEGMHIVQAYPPGSGPGWLTEGIADYARAKYGISNEEGGWSLPGYTENAHYTNSYRITARFLMWITKKYDEDLVAKLNKHLHEDTYYPSLWKEYTDYHLDELWNKYTENPALSQL